MNTVILLAVALAGLSDASSLGARGSSAASDRIVGGSSTTIQNYPYQVSLQYSARHICGASIVSKDYVLTAGHCVVAPASRLSIRAGSSFFERGGSVHPVKKVTRHENFQVNRQGVPTNDIAVMQVASPFVLDATRRAIGLFQANERLAAGSSAAITGWGRTSNLGSSPSQLQMAVVPIVETSLCNRAYRLFGGLPRGQICAGFYDKGGRDACQGDSGGPLAVAGRLAGIVSWGNDCALASFPGVYTEVAFFREWINRHAELSR